MFKCPYPPVEVICVFKVQTLGLDENTEDKQHVKTCMLTLTAILVIFVQMIITLVSCKDLTMASSATARVCGTRSYALTYLWQEVLYSSKP